MSRGSFYASWCIYVSVVWVCFPGNIGEDLITLQASHPL